MQSRNKRTALPVYALQTSSPTHLTPSPSHPLHPPPPPAITKTKVVPQVDQSGLERELNDVHCQRVSVMDAVCELLSDIPASQISSMFGVSSDHIQRKLAMRYTLCIFYTL